MNETELYNRVAQKIREVRRACHLSQESLGSQIGLSRAAIANIESGRQQILVHTIYRIAGACNLDPLKIFPNSNETNFNNEKGLSLEKALKGKISKSSAEKIIKRLRGVHQ